MGYITSYSLSIDTGGDYKEYNETMEKLNQFIKDLNDDKYGDLKELVDNQFLDAKWYYYDSDMLFISKEFPNVMFTLNGIGEDQCDIWCKTYFNGEVRYFEQAKMVDQFKDENEKNEHLNIINRDALYGSGELYYLLKMNLDLFEKDELAITIGTKRLMLERWLKDHEHYFKNK